MMPLISTPSYAALVTDAVKEKGIFTIDYSDFPEISIFGFFNPNEKIEIKENNMACKPLDNSFKNAELTAAICLGRTDTLDIPFEDAQNLAFFTYSRLSTLIRFSVHSIGLKAETHLDKPTMDSGLIRSAIFQIKGLEKESFTDALIETIEKLKKNRGPKILLYFGAVKVGSNRLSISKNSFETLKNKLLETDIPLVIFSTIPDMIDGKIVDMVKKSKGMIFGNTETEDIEYFEKKLLSIKNNLKKIKYLSPITVKDGIFRKIELDFPENKIKDNQEKKLFSHNYYPQITKEESRKLIITVKDENRNPRSCFFELFNQNKSITKSKISDEGILIINNLEHNDYKVTVSDGNNSMTGTINFSNQNEKHLNFVFAYKKLEIIARDQYEKPLDLKYAVTALPDNNLVFQGKTGSEGTSILQLLPGNYAITGNWKLHRVTREFQITPDMDHTEKFLFTRKNFTLAAIDLYNKPVQAEYEIKGSNNFFLKGILQADGKADLDLLPGEYRANLKYLNQETVKHFKVETGLISGSTSKFPLFPVSLESFSSDQKPQPSNVAVIDTQSLQTVYKGKTGKNGTVLVHLYQGSYKFIFSVGTTRIELFERIKDKKNYHIRADFSKSLLKLILYKENNNPVKGWYQITSASGKKTASGHIRKGGSEVRLPIGNYSVLFRTSIMDDSQDIIKDINLTLEGARLEARLESKINISFSGPKNQEIEKCWYILKKMDEYSREESLMEGRIFKEGRTICLYPGKYEIMIKPSPYGKINVKEIFDMKPETAYSFNADFSGRITIASEITDSTENPVYRLYDEEGKNELERGEIDNASHLVLVPPGKYQIKISPFFSSAEVFTKDFEIKKDENLTIKKDFKIK
jgi:ribonucleotide reductase alpha subunit